MVRVDKDVPLPAVRRTGHRGGVAAKYPWAKMEVGDSFFVAKDAATIGASANAWAHRNNPFAQFSVLKVVEAGVVGARAWRVA